MRQFPVSWRLIGRILGVLSCCGTALSQPEPLEPSQPDELAERSLVAWPWNRSTGRDDSDLRGVLYDFRVTVYETITRQGRSTSIEYSACGRFGFDWISSSRDTDPDSSITTIRFWPQSLDLHASAGRTKYQLTLDSNSLVDTRVGPTPRVYAMTDRVGSSSATLSVLLKSPGTIQMKPQAWAGVPTSPELLSSVSADWLAESLYVLFPPLPNRMIDMGSSWKSGVPIPMSTVASPRVHKVDYSLATIDPQSGDMEINFRASLPAGGLRSRSGVSHVGPDAVSQGSMSGQMFLDQRTNVLTHSRAEINATLSHERSSDTTATYRLVVEVSAVRPPAHTEAADSEDAASPIDDDPFAPIGG